MRNWTAGSDREAPGLRAVPDCQGSGERCRGYPGPSRAKEFPKGSAFASLTAARERQPSPAGGRKSARAQTDPPKHLFFSTGRGAFASGLSAALQAVGLRHALASAVFLMSQKENGGAQERGLKGGRRPLFNYPGGTPCRCTSSTSARCRRGRDRCGRSC